MIKSKRQFPDLPHFASLIEWKLPSIFRTRTKLARALTINDLAKIASEIFKKRLTKPHCFNALDNKGMEITSFLPDFFSLGIFW